MNGFRLGVNYWPRERGLQKWADWDPEGIVRDLARIRELGLDHVRIFLLWPAFQPAPDAVAEEALERLDDFLALAGRHNLLVIPTLFTGHMSGTDWDVAWRGGKSPYRDPAVLRAQARQVAVLARRYRGDERIAAWDLANEPDVFVHPETKDAGWLWTRLLAREFRAHDPSHPVTLGIHQASLLEDNGFRPADVAESVDFMCMHMYPFYTPACPDPLDSLRSGYAVACAARLTAGMTGMPVLAEEFGASTLMHGEERAAGYLSVTIWSLLANGAAGALAWCYTDPARPDRSPYNENPYESGFGLVDPDGYPKATGKAMRRVSEALRRIGPGLSSGRERPVPGPARAAIVIPERYHDGPDPDLTPERHFRVLFNAFVLAKQAGIAADFLPAGRLAEGVPDGYSLIILPSMPRRGAVTMRHFQALQRFVAGGGVLYASYDGIAVPPLADIFGAVPEDAFLPVDDRPWSLVAAPDLPPAVPPAPADLTCPARPGRRALQVRPRTATVLATDAGGRPAFLWNRYGKGHALLATFPLELAVSFLPDAFRPGPAAGGRGLYWLYDTAAALTGDDLLRPVGTGDPWLEAAVLERPGSDNRTLLLINHHPAEAACTVFVRREDFPDPLLTDQVSGRRVALAESPDGSRRQIHLSIPGSSAALLKP